MLLKDLLSEPYALRLATVAFVPGKSTLRYLALISIIDSWLVEYSEITLKERERRPVVCAFGNCVNPPSIEAYSSDDIGQSKTGEKRTNFSEWDSREEYLYQYEYKISVASCISLHIVYIIYFGDEDDRELSG